MADLTPEEQAAADAKAKADADAATAAAEAKAKADAEVKFSQAELDRIAGTSRADGRGQATKELLEKLGVDSVEALEARVKAAKDAEDAGKTELQKAQEERDAAKAEAGRASELAHRAVAVSRVEGQLRDAGIKSERIPAALKLVDLGSLKVEGTDVSGVSEAVASVKEISPEWFGTVKHTAPDASQQQGGEKDYRAADRETVAADLYKEYGVRI